jgi:hypothetical protein
MKLEVPIKVDIDDITKLIHDLQCLQTYKLGANDTTVLVSLDAVIDVFADHIKAGMLGKADAIKWIPIKTRPLTGEEKEEYPEWDCFLDCELPDDGQEILVTYKVGNKKMVSEDTFFNDDCCYLDSGLELGEDVLAWAEKPKPWKGE